jgi:hypothetical protein
MGGNFDPHGLRMVETPDGVSLMAPSKHRPSPSSLKGDRRLYRAFW